jgi:site-specific recombinase XerD
MVALVVTIAYIQRMTFISPEVDPLLASWVRALRAGGKSPRTIESYVGAVTGFSDWCAVNGRPIAPSLQRRADVEDYIGWIIDTRSSGTAGVRYRSLRQWFRWLASENESDDVMAGMAHPKLDEHPPAIISDDQLRALLEVTKGRDFIDRRDNAMFRILIDTGMRRGELAGMRVVDVDLDGQVLLIQRSKTGKGRLVPIGTKTTAATDRYLRLRPAHRNASRPELWLGLHGPLTGEGVRQMLINRCRQAGIPELFVHQFRHTAAHRWLLAGGQEQDLARIAGWTPGSAMLARYGASAASERARAAHQRIAPGDSL